MRRRSFLALSLACLPLCRGQAADRAPRLATEEVQVAYENETYIGRFSFLVPVAPGVAWEVLTDFDRMVAFVPNLAVSRILAREKDGLLVAQRGHLDFGLFSIPFESERRIQLHRREGLILSLATAGSARHMQSEMRLTPEGTGTRLDYRVEMVPNTWIPTSLGVSCMRQELAEQFSALAREMARRQQARTPS